MNVFIGYMLPTFGKNMDMEVIQMIDQEVANIVNEQVVEKFCEIEF